MTMEIFGVLAEVVTLAVPLGTGGVSMVVLLFVAAVGFAVAVLVVGVAPLLAAAALRPSTSLEIVVGALLPTGDTALTVETTPITRALEDVASLVDFSRICRCFSSSLARIETKSSGIGLFS